MKRMFRCSNVEEEPIKIRKFSVKKKGEIDDEKSSSKKKTKIPGFQGNLYQSKLLMLYLHRGLSPKYEYTILELGTEIKKADRDLVFKYKKNVNGQERDHFILLLANHESNTKSQKTYDEIFTDGNGNFESFNAFKKAKNDETFKDGVIEHVIIHTNANIDMIGMNPEKNRYSNNLKYTSDVIKEVKAEPNSVLSLTKVGGGKYYQFKSDLVLPMIKPMLSDYYEIAKTLIKVLKEGKNLSLDDFLKNYNYLLTTEVIDMNTMTFRDDFWNEKYENTESATGRQKLKNALDKVINDEKLNKDEIFKIKFKIENIGQQCNSQQWPADESDEDIRKYLETLIFAVDQPNEIELQNIILSEIDEKYKQYEADFVYSYFCTEIQKWMKGEIFDSFDSDVSDCRFISSKSAKEFFEKTKQKFDTKVLQGPINDYDKFINLSCFNSVNSELEKSIQDFLSSERHILNIVSEEVIISSIKVYNELVKIGNLEIIYLRLSSSNESSIDLVIEAFESESTNHLIVIESDLDQTGELNVSEKSIENLFFRIIDVIQNNKAKKIIIISKEEDILVTNLESAFSTEAELKKIKDNKNFQTNFSEDSQVFFLNTPINFQGFKVKLSNLINSDDLEIIKNQEILLKILKNEEISIGRPIHGLQNMQNYYVNRKFIYEMKSKKNVYLLSNINEQDLYDDSVVQKLKVNDECWKNSLSNDESRILNRSAEENNSMNIYLLRKENNVLNLLKQSTDPINVADFEKTISHESNCGINLISAIAGMGKSTLLTNLSRKIKEHNHKLWVVIIDLNDVSTKLEEIKNSGRVDDQTAIDFLLCSAKIASEMEKSIFECYLLRRNVILYLDGFDKICPDYKEVIFEIIIKLMNITKIKEIWISTRPCDSILDYMKVLFKNMSLKRYEIEPFTEKNQKDFLYNFWKETIDINVEFFNIFVTKLFYLLNNKIEDKRMEFLGQILHTNLIAVTFKNTFEQFQKNADLSESYEKELEKMLQLSKLYKSFIKSKHALYIENKSNLILDKDEAKNTFKELYKKSTIKHKLLALDLIFNENQLKTFLTAKEIEYLEISKNEIKDKGNKVGIVNRVINGRTHFVHQTFAEYFVASFFIEHMTKGTETSKTIVEYFLNNMINVDSSVICEFVNSMMEDDNFTQYIINYDLIRNLEKRTIHCVLENNFQNIAKLLIAQGVNLNYTDKNKTVLHLASVLRNTKENEKSVLQLIVEKLEMNEVILKEMLCSIGSDGNTPLFLAVKHGILENIEALVGVCQKYKVLNVILGKENNKKECILHLPTGKNYEKSLDYLLGLLKSKPETLKELLIKEDENGNNSFALAAMNGKLKIVQAILSICNEFTITDTVLLNENSSGKNVLHQTAGKDFQDDMFISLLGIFQRNPITLKTLLIKKDEIGNNPFAIAAMNGQSNNLQAILSICYELKIVGTVLLNENWRMENVLHQTAGKYFQSGSFNYLLGVLKSVPEILKKLLIKTNRNGDNSFAIAAINGQSNNVQAIWDICNELEIKHLVFPNKDTKKGNFLHVAAGKYFQGDIFAFLLGILKSEPATLKNLLIQNNRNGDNPFGIAALNGQSNNLQAILSICCELKIINTVLMNENLSKENVLHRTAGKYIQPGSINILLGILKSEPVILKELLIKKDKNGNNPFIIAALCGESNDIRSILDICKELKIKDTVLMNENSRGENVLHQRARKYDFQLTNLYSLLDILKSEPDTLKTLLLKTNKNGDIPFTIAALMGNSENLQALVSICNELKIKDAVLMNKYSSGENILHLIAGKKIEDNMEDGMGNGMFISLLGILKTKNEALNTILIKRDQNDDNPIIIAGLKGQSNNPQAISAVCNDFKIVDNVLVIKNTCRANFLHQSSNKLFKDNLLTHMLMLLGICPETLKTLLIKKNQSGDNPFNIAALNGHSNNLQAIFSICNDLEIKDKIFVRANSSMRYFNRERWEIFNREDMNRSFSALLKFLKSEPKTLKTLIIQKDQNGDNPFAIAALNRNSKSLQDILSVCNELEITDTVLLNENSSGKNVLHQTAGKNLQNGMFTSLLGILKSEPEILKTLLIKKDGIGNNPFAIAVLNGQSNNLQDILSICNELQIKDTVLEDENTNGENILHLTAREDFQDGTFNFLLDILKSEPETLKRLITKKDQNGNNPFAVAAMNGKSNNLQAILDIYNELQIKDTVLEDENTNGENILHLTAGNDFQDGTSNFLLDILKCEPETLKRLMIKKDQNGNNPFAIAAMNGKLNFVQAILSICNDFKITDIVLENENSSSKNVLHQTAGKDFQHDMFISLLGIFQRKPKTLKTLLIKKDGIGNNPFAIAARNGQSNNLQAILSICYELKIVDTVLLNENWRMENVLHQTAGKDFQSGSFNSLLGILKSEPATLKKLLIQKDRNGDNPFAIAALNGQSNNLHAILSVCYELKIIDAVLVYDNSSGENVLHQTAGKNFKLGIEDSMEEGMFISLLGIIKTEKETLKKILITNDQIHEKTFTITELKGNSSHPHIENMKLNIIDPDVANENMIGENISQQIARKNYLDNTFISLLNLLKIVPEELKTLLIKKDQNGNNPLGIAALNGKSNNLQAILSICNELKITDTVLVNENSSGKNILHLTAGKDFQDSAFNFLLGVLKSEPETLKALLLKKDHNGDNPFAIATLNRQSKNLHAILDICNELKITDTVLANENTTGENVLHLTAGKNIKDGMFTSLPGILKTKKETLNTILIKKDQNGDNPTVIAALSGQSNNLQAILALCNEFKIIEKVRAKSSIENAYKEELLHRTAEKLFNDGLFISLLGLFKSEPEILKTLLIKKDQNGDNTFTIATLNEQSINIQAILDICHKLEIKDTVLTNENSSRENVLHQTTEKDFHDGMFISLLGILKSAPEILKALLIKKDQNGNNPFAIAALNGQLNCLQAILDICNELKIKDTVLVNENSSGENVLHQTAEKDFQDGIFISLLGILKSVPEILKVLLIKKNQNGDNPFTIAVLNGQLNKQQAILTICNELEIIL